MALDKADRGFAWVVMSACFVLNMLLAFSFASFGFLMVEYIEYFNEDKTVTSWIGAVLFATTGIMGVFAGPLVQRFGCRRMTYVGTMLVFVGLASSAYVPNVYVLYLTHGLIAGTGYSLWSVCGLVAVQQFFDKRRGFATAFTTVGKSAGVLLWSWLTPFTIHTYNFKGALLIQAAVSLHGLVIAAILRSPMFEHTHSMSKTPGRTEVSVDKGYDQCVQDGVSKYDTDFICTANETQTMSSKSKSVSPMGSFHELGTCRPTVEVDRYVPRTEVRTMCRTNVKLSDLLDFTLLYKVPKITLYYTSTFLVIFGDQVPYVYLPLRLAETGRSKGDAALLVMILGISTIAGRLLCGWVADVIDRNVTYALTALATGLASAAFAYVTNFGALIAYCLVFSFATAGYSCCGYTLVGDIVGMGRLAKGTGLLFFFIGIGLLLGTPLGGFITDVTGNTSMAFLVLGLIQAAGGLLWVGVIMYEWCHDASKRTCLRNPT